MWFVPVVWWNGEHFQHLPQIQWHSTPDSRRQHQRIPSQNLLWEPVGLNIIFFRILVWIDQDMIYGQFTQYINGWHSKPNSRRQHRRIPSQNLLWEPVGLNIIFFRILVWIDQDMRYGQFTQYINGWHSTPDSRRQHRRILSQNLLWEPVKLNTIFFRILVWIDQDMRYGQFTQYINGWHSTPDSRRQHWRIPSQNLLWEPVGLNIIFFRIWV